MEAYRAALTGENATLMVEPDSAFFDYLRSPEAAPARRRRRRPGRSRTRTRREHAHRAE